MSTRPPYDDQATLRPGESGYPVARADSRAVFGQVMFLVAVTAGFAAIGAYVGRDLSMGAALVAYLAGFGVLLGLSFARKAQNGGLGMGLLFLLGLLLGLGIGPTIQSYTSADPGVVWQAAGLTGLFIAGFGAAGWATKRDLAPLARIAFFALLGLIAFAVIAIFVTIPAANLIWSIAGLAIFSVFTMYDFQRLRRAGQEDVIMLAVSIFLDVFNVFLMMLSLLGGNR
jgi:modulator of FtsH protease